MLDSQSEGQNAAEGMSDDVEGLDFIGIKNRGFDHVDVLFQCVEGIGRLRALTKAKKIDGEEPI